jgi:hypothetical protein
MPTPTDDAGAWVTVPPGNAVIGEGSVGRSSGRLDGWLVGWPAGWLDGSRSLEAGQTLLCNTQRLHPWATLMRG